ncbi:MAG TPA: hypothetical protein VMF31_07520 [Solirubrobacterales bacterium]|nr:hypothetical protein [Solirubrobacterales bacterium]
MCPPRPSENDAEALPPGAERFWGQFSQARAGRTGAEDKTGGDETAEATEAQGHGCLEWCPICRSAELLKGATSPEVREQIHAIQSEAIQVFKAFAAAYSERTAEDPFSREHGETSGESRRREPDGSGPPDAPIDISIE